MYQINDEVQIRQYPAYVFKVCELPDMISSDLYDIQIIAMVDSNHQGDENIGVHLKVDLDAPGQVLQLLHRGKIEPIREVKLHRRFRYSTV